MAGTVKFAELTTKSVTLSCIACGASCATVEYKEEPPVVVRPAEHVRPYVPPRHLVVGVDKKE